MTQSGNLREERIDGTGGLRVEKFVDYVSGVVNLVTLAKSCPMKGSI
jgi:hypothetical protein